MEKIRVQNLKCGGCAKTIIQKLSELDFVSNVEVAVEESIVSVNLTDLNKLTAIKQTLSKLGYPAENDSNSIGKKAKSYVSCAIGKIG